MNLETTQLNGVVLLTPDKYDDNRGYFTETFNHEFYNKIIPDFLGTFVQDNESCSKKNVFRGFHWQAWPMQQSKLVRVVRGKIIDIVICLIKDSPDYGKYIGFELSAENRKQLFVPRGYAHGFVSLEDDTIVNYKVDNYYSPNHERTLSYSAVDFSIFGISNTEDLIISEKDSAGALFGNLKDEDVFFLGNNTNQENNIEQEKTNKKESNEMQLFGNEQPKPVN